MSGAPGMTARGWKAAIPALLLAGLLALPAAAQTSNQNAQTSATDAAAAQIAAETPAIVDSGQINPTARAVTEDALLDALRPGQPIVGRISIPDDRAAGLIKPENREWAYGGAELVHTLSTILIVITLLALLAFYLVKGRIRIAGGRSGVRITRFRAIDRFAHWLMAVSFIILALTGLNLILGRTLLLPVLGEGGFGGASAWGKLLHNFVGWAFIVGLAMSFLLWVGRNVPHARDWAWIKAGGGFVGGRHAPPAGKFNAGQKVIFWSVAIGGIALSITGILLLFPGVMGFGTWQTHQIIHAVAAGILTAVVLAHIYIGSVGMEGAFEAMGSGEVDLNWAREHHELWVQEVRAEGEVPPRGAATPAE